MLYVTIVNPERKPPIQLRDLIRVPVKDTRSKWNLGDMLSLESVENLWKAYTALTEPEKKRHKALRAPHTA